MMESERCRENRKRGWREIKREDGKRDKERG